MTPFLKIAVKSVLRATVIVAAATVADKGLSQVKFMK